MSKDDVRGSLDTATSLFSFASTAPKAKAGEEIYERPIVAVPQITLGLRKLNNVPIALVKSRDNKTTNLLLNRDTMSKMGYVVHPNNAHILTKEMEKVKIV